MTDYWSVGHNMPGYLPMADTLTVTDDWVNALEILREDIDRATDMQEELHDEADIAFDAIDEMIKDNDPTTHGHVVFGDIGNEVYWIDSIDQETYKAWIDDDGPF